MESNQKTEVPVPQNVQEEQVPETIQDATTKKDLVKDFFNFKEAKSDIKEFIGDMKIPVEEVEPPPGIDSPNEVDTPADPSVPGGEDPEIDEIASHLDFTEEHKYTAEFALIQIDKVMAFGFGFLSGENSDKYRRRKEKIQGNDYELEIAAALVKKYQMRMKLEWMFISAFLMGYAPMAEKAWKDRAKNIEKKNQERLANISKVQPINHQNGEKK